MVAIWGLTSNHQAGCPLRIPPATSHGLVTDPLRLISRLLELKVSCRIHWGPRQTSGNNQSPKNPPLGMPVNKEHWPPKPGAGVLLAVEHNLFSTTATEDMSPGRVTKIPPYPEKPHGNQGRLDLHGRGGV